MTPIPASLPARNTLSLPALLLRLEGLLVFLGAVGVYAHLHYAGLVFLLLLFVPDLGMLGYAANPRVGSHTYNAMHTYVIPAALLAVASGSTALTGIALIWLAHIGMDRTLGYGLKYPTTFKDTHLNQV
jgi:hypothetical protein